ncbi:phage portal protein [Methylovirgula sp. 4M-Z18]|uniref:phage portal protein n=1 Tax=Methylovirgula sp. 4M-Z18 TaxID=2293567 RepID=UPI000E2ED0F0|nr:phage portal protein [Methylovirgula sp. 4M-Z18]RFB80410.1 phage portal protein [Methylovirgula sp. 4M-Z18]
MGIFDSVAAVFSTNAAAKRELAKVAGLVARGVKRELSLRGYDAARPGRANWGWFAASTSANAEIYGGLVALRNHSRELVRNNGHAAKAIRVLTNNVVGTGIMVQARTPNKKLNARINGLFADWIKICDFNGQLDFYGLQRLAVRGMLEGGESVTRLRTVTGAKIPLKLQLLEGDFIDHFKNDQLADGSIKQGIEFDRDGRRRKFWLFGEHPGEMPIRQPKSYVSNPVPADQILHLYEILRIGQIRGVPWLTPGMTTARDLGTYGEAERVRKRIEACVAAIVMGADDPDQEGIAPKVTDSAGNIVEQFEPGLIAIARGSKDIKFTQPASNGSFHEYKRTELQELAAAWAVTYEALTGDLSRVNFSSLKGGQNQFQREVEIIQWLCLVPMWLDGVWRAFIDACKVAGEIPQNASYDYEATTPKFESLDPEQDANGDVALVRATFMPPQEAIRRRGYDPEKVLADTKAWHEALVGAGLKSDSDPALSPKTAAAAQAPVAGNKD